MTKRLLVTGSQGQVAQALHRAAAGSAALAVEAVGRPALDLEKPEATAAAIIALRPDIMVNAAAFTAVDLAETDKDKAFAINRDGAGAVAQAAARLGIPLVHLSTDYVFDGRKPAPYVEDDETAPLGVYGASKRAGEIAVLAACPWAVVIRTAWVYSPFGGNFVKTMLRLGATRDVLRVVDDQIGNPTSALDLAEALVRIAPALTPSEGGIYHLAGTGHTSWCGLARHVFAASHALGGPAPAVEAIATADYPAKAARPARSWLSSAKFANRFGFALPDWQGSASAVVRELLAGP